jgi:hypothetical protein
MRAARDGEVDALKQFLAAGMAVDVEDAEATTALFRAAQYGRAEAAKLLISRGANVNVSGTGWDTPLIAAARAGSLETVQALLDAGADAGRRSEKNWTALTAAAFAGNSEIIKLLSDKGHDSLDEALQIASLQGQTSVIDALLNAGASVFSRSKDNKTPLMYAAMNGHLDAVRILLMHGANRFALDSRDRTAADHAAAAEHHEIVAFLNDPQLPLPAVDRPPSSEGAVASALPGAAEDPPARVQSFGAPAPGLAVASISQVPPINGARLGGLSDGQTATVQSRMRMKDYREVQLPIMLESVADDGEARIRVLHHAKGEARLVGPGTAIADTGLELVRTERRFRNSKMGDGHLLDVSQAIVRDVASGQRHLVVRNVPAHASEASALVSIESATYAVREGDEFTAGGGQPVRYRVLDVRPTQVVMENRETGETFTLPRARRG